MRHWKRLWGVGAVVATVGGYLVAPAAPAMGDVLGCGSVVTTSVTLTADLGPCPGVGLTVRASGVTVNLAGHTIRGDGNPASTPDQVGIHLLVVSNVVVKGGTVRDFNAGILMSQGSHNTVSDMTVTANVGTATSSHGDGIFLFASNDNQLLRNKVTSNGPISGINLSVNSSRNLVQASMITDNNIILPGGPDNDPDQVDTGVNFDGAAQDNTIQGNQILRNGKEGVGAGGPDVGHRRVLNNIVRDNGVNGINTGGGGGDLVDGNIVDHNGYDQFRVDPSQPSHVDFSGGIVMCGSCLGPGPLSTFTHNTVTNNKSDGVAMLFNYFACCNGFVRDFVRPNLIQYNTVTGNGGDGIYVECDQTFAPFPATPESALFCIHAPTHPGIHILNNNVRRNGRAGAGVTAWDLHDGNSDCGYDVWSGNTYDTANPPCTRG